MIEEVLNSKIDFSSNANCYQSEKNINITNNVFNRSNKESYNMFQDLKEIRKQLKKDNIIVRKCGSFDYLSNDWLHFSVKDEISQKKLEASLQNI